MGKSRSKTKGGKVQPTLIIKNSNNNNNNNKKNYNKEVAKADTPSSGPETGTSAASVMVEASVASAMGSTTVSEMEAKSTGMEASSIVSDMQSTSLPSDVEMKSDLPEIVATSLAPKMNMTLPTPIIEKTSDIETKSRVPEKEKTPVVPDMEMTSPVPLAIEVDIKHPLENTWCFWMYTNKKKKWEDNLVQLASFDTVEDYWCLYHYMFRPSELANGQDYAIFKEGIRPMWEDAANEKGGRWLYNFERKNDIDWIWLDTVLLMIGENFENNQEVCGVVINIRQKCKIGVWTADATNQQANEEIGKKLRSVIGKLGKLGYQVHNTTKNIYYID